MPPRPRTTRTVFKVDLPPTLSPTQKRDLRRGIVRNIQAYQARILLQRIRRVIPVRSGNLRKEFRFAKLAQGGRFYFTAKGFYYIFQEGLEEDIVKILRRETGRSGGVVAARRNRAAAATRPLTGAAFRSLLVKAIIEALAILIPIAVAAAISELGLGL